ncbi:primosomal protein N' [Kordiimonas sediminis]|uniref:Replication restart protein PriA n=1 Tax=Kordiimonas sediminis TaxID=1735581 RepID=A0A919ARC2_9PROT|nr:primosomal protein N' [Kordiimonas sediminis]GHF20306.1 primosomal protein N' [Kordiimonas sediminis]
MACTVREDEGKERFMQHGFFDDREQSQTETGPKGTVLRVPVVTTAPLGVLDYRWDNEMPPPEPGLIVEVPLGGRKVRGVIWHKASDQSGKKVSDAKLKSIEKLYDVPPLSEELLKLVAWVAAYTLSPLGSVLKMCLPVQAALEEGPSQTGVCWTADCAPPARMTHARQAVLDAAADGRVRTVPELAKTASVSDAVVRGLMKCRALQTTTIAADSPYGQPDISRHGPELSQEQTIAAEAIKNAVFTGGFAPFLLDGITGSGKTEVYFEGLAEALKTGGAQVLVLVPEIALTSQWLDRFHHRFGVRPVVWHSDVGQAERRRAWRQIATGEARVVVGARSALFLPFRHLAFITVDEEHDPSYKQEEGVLYHGRDMAVVRAKYAECPIVLASATPSMESLVNANSGRYVCLKLRERHGQAVLPDIHTIDMRKHPPAAGSWLSPKLKEAIDKRLFRHEQTMLFLNRRGYAPLTLCRTCGHRIECPNCSAWLVEHRFKHKLECHHCGHEIPVPEACPQCDTADSLVACGPGVERLFEEVNRDFPSARIGVMTSDTMESPTETATMVHQIAEGRLDIIIGTQIVTKGYHFPNLTLVGVIDADLGLRGGDLRAGERTYQQLEQVAGRAGRADKPGEVLLQSYEPDHPVITALANNDGEHLMRLEGEAREKLHMPPFGRLAALILSGPNQRTVMEQGRLLAVSAPASGSVQVYGPAPAPMARVRGNFRMRMLLHAHKGEPVQVIIRDWFGRTKMLPEVKVKVDIDPYSFM